MTNLLIFKRYLIEKLSPSTVNLRIQNLNKYLVSLSNNRQLFFRVFEVDNLEKL